MSSPVVIKVGTSVLTGGSGTLDRPHFAELARQMALVQASGRAVILCTSGAIAAGRERVGLNALPDDLATRQMLASVGQTRLMAAWESAFAAHDLMVGQLLLTRADTADRERYLNARDALDALLEHGVIPVVNENDAVATTEIKVGDNDNLSALLAVLAGADQLVLLTDQPGLFTADPRTNPDAELMPEIARIDREISALAGGAISGLGTGGMTTKLQAARTAQSGGVETVIASGRAPDVILRAVAGEPVGTRFPRSSRAAEGRRRWILAGTGASGVLTVDAGAARALREGGASLLVAGLQSVTGDFLRGATVRVVGPDHEEIGRGLARLAAREARKVAGSRSDAISGILGYGASPIIIHRNEFILT